MSDILEKKWTSIVKLKKQVMELERQIKEMKENGLPDGGTDRQTVAFEGLPRQPEKYIL